MKVELIIPKVQQTRKFPLIARSLDSGRIVRFLSDNYGTELINQCGRTSESTNCSWNTCFDTAIWEILPPGTQIILTQE